MALQDSEKLAGRLRRCLREACNSSIRCTSRQSCTAGLSYPEAVVLSGHATMRTVKVYLFPLYGLKDTANLLRLDFSL